MPYMLVKKENGQECVYKHDANHMPVGESHGCHDTHEQALAQMRALYAAESKAFDVLAKAFDALAPTLSPDELEALTGLKATRADVTEADKKRAEHEYGDVAYADEANKKYPIDNEEHIRAAWNYIHQAKNAAKYSAAEVDSIKRKIVAAWKNKIDKNGPPAATKAQMEDLLSVGFKAMYDQAASDYLWCGVSHNAWQDDVQDIIPLALIEDDIAFQKRLIQKGYADQFGDGLWIDHNPKPVIGDCQLREVVSDGRFCFEMGNLNPDYKRLDGSQMSVSYTYGQKAKQYAWVYVFERSALEHKRRVNGRTFFSVKQRGLLKDATLGAVADEVTALLEETA